MPSKQFLEEYPLYRKFNVDQLPSTTDQLPVIQINMDYPTCKSSQTFAMTNKYWENCDCSNYPVKGIVFRMIYLCVHCQKFERAFYVKVDNSNKWFMKVGQYPSWETKGNVNIEKHLGEHSSYYRKGLVCESQGYGIGACGYSFPSQRIGKGTKEKMCFKVFDICSEFIKILTSFSFSEISAMVVFAGK